jgi:hypothetical protein
VNLLRGGGPGGLLHRVVVLGSPGTGKSQGLLWLLHLLVHDNISVVFESKKLGVLVHFSYTASGYRVYQAKASDVGDQDAAFTKSAFYLCDPSVGKSPVRFVSSRTVLASSPNPSQYKEITKDQYGSVVIKVFMPMWSVDELVQAAPLILPGISEQSVRERFYWFGGIVRHVLGTPASCAEVWAQTVNIVHGMSTPMLSTVTSGSVTITDSTRKAEVASSLVAGLNPREDSQFLSVSVPVSAGVCALLVQRARAVKWADIDELHMTPGAQSWAGALFEQAVLLALQGGGVFASVRLRDRQRVLLRLPEVAAQSMRTLPDGPQDYLSIPVARNFPAVDAVGPGQVVFQVTLVPPDKHAFEVCHVLEVVNALRCTSTNKLIWVHAVPRSRFGEYALAGPQSLRPGGSGLEDCIEQFVICFPALKEEVASHVAPLWAQVPCFLGALSPLLRQYCVDELSRIKGLFRVVAVGCLSTRTWLFVFAADRDRQCCEIAWSHCGGNLQQMRTRWSQQVKLEVPRVRIGSL